MKYGLLLLVVGGVISASQPSIPDSQIDAALKELQSPIVDNRITAFYAIVHAGLATDPESQFPVPDGVLAIARANAASRARLTKALTDLLETETAFERSGAAPATEDYSNYYGDVIHAVTTLRDSSSLQALMRCINTGGMAQKALASFGDPALTEGSKELPAADEETRNSLFRLFAGMAEPRNMSNLKTAESRTALLNILVMGTKDSNPHSRRISAEGLSHFSSPEAVAAVNRLAATDPYKVPDPNGTMHYPVREAATKAAQAQEQLRRERP